MRDRHRFPERSGKRDGWITFAGEVTAPPPQVTGETKHERPNQAMVTIELHYPVHMGRLRLLLGKRRTRRLGRLTSNKNGAMAKKPGSHPLPRATQIRKARRKAGIFITANKRPKAEPRWRAQSARISCCSLRSTTPTTQVALTRVSRRRVILGVA